ncbi:hypothetical protein 8UZL_00005 [Mycobacteroides phage 8UZL]|nr:hypothetical protein 8UZL_00005 [Mycobacteroides phage 8UZL]
MGLIGEITLPGDDTTIEPFGGQTLEHRHSTPEARAVQAIVDRVQYKIDWWFTVMENYMLGYPALKIVSAPVHDSYHPGNTQMARVEMMHPIPHGIADWPLKQQVYWIQECIRAMELHEMDEWLKIDGVMLHDPHSGKKWEPADAVTD